jgi:translation initiation factor IF-3
LRVIPIARPAEPRVNEEIRAREVRLIDEDGIQLGIKPIQEAFSLAQTRAKDLVEISPGASPPVVKIVDFSKFRYEREKRLKESRKHQKAGVLKEIRLHTRISEHDLGTKVEHTREFIEEKDKVRITVVFRGREMEHRDLGLALLNRIKEMLGAKCMVEQEPQLDGNRMSILLAPKK